MGWARIERREQRAARHVQIVQLAALAARINRRRVAETHPRPAWTAPASVGLRPSRTAGRRGFGAVTGLVPLLALVMAVGTVGTVVPLVPGISLVWGAGLAYGLVQGFGTVGAPAFALMTGLAVGGTVAGYVVPKRRAAGAGASRETLWLGIAGAVIGLFVVPVVGLPIGGALGIYVGERLRTGDSTAAYRATRATITGFGVAALVQFAAALSMIAVWVVWVIID